MKTYTDTDRLDWLQSTSGAGLINDDFGRWAVSGSGIQNIPDDHTILSETTFFVEAADWKPTIREAIDAAMEATSDDV
jgi:hypothetical protein